MDVVTKATAEVTPVEDSTSKHGQFDVILSTNALDRDGDELHADEWKTPLPDKITFDSDHGMSVATCVGSGKPFINDEGKLQVRGTFASTPHGQAVRTLVNEGHITSVSVAFMNHKTQKSGKPVRELLNGAFVAVPANPEARVLASKAARKDAANWRDDTMAAVAAMFDNDPLDGGDQSHKTAYYQGVHDLAVKLGAGCPYSDPQATPGVLNGVGNRSANPEYVTLKEGQEMALAGGVSIGVENGRYVLKDTKSSPTESTEDSDTSTETEPDTGNAETDSDTGTETDETVQEVALLGKSLAIKLGLIDL